MLKKRYARKIFTGVVFITLLIAVVISFAPKPALVDIGRVEKGSMVVTLNEEGRTQVRQVYRISAPVTGKLLRINADPGDKVVKGESVIARIIPIDPPTLNAREKLQAEALVSAAENALTYAQADYEVALTNERVAKSTFLRSQKQFKTGAISESDFEETERLLRNASSMIKSADATINIRQAELASARAALTNLDSTSPLKLEEIQLRSPINGQILNVLEKSEVTVSAGTPLVEVGDVKEDLEVVIELLSTDAVRIAVGQKVIIDNWGGTTPLLGSVSRIDPYGFTKYSALGVEEQRVKVIVQFAEPLPKDLQLGHGFRVDALIVLHENKDVLKAPASALFREKSDWAVFIVNNGVAQLRKVKIGHNNGLEAVVLEGLQADDLVILYPASNLVDGMNVIQR